MTTRAAVLGSPVAHSLSPALHRSAYAALGLDARYDAVELGRGELAGFLDGCGPEWRGLSLTMPLKEEAVLVAAHGDELTELLGVANTLVPGHDGWRATNTDVVGIVNALEGVIAERAVIVGAGASARSALAAMDRLGVGIVEVVARRLEQAGDCAQLGSALGLQMSVACLETGTQISDAELCIVTMPPHAADAIDVTGSCGTLLDIAYDPWPSRIATVWLQHGGRVVPGHEMLLQQAAEQVRLMTGRTPPVEAMRRGMEAELEHRR